MCQLVSQLLSLAQETGCVLGSRLELVSHVMLMRCLDKVLCYNINLPDSFINLVLLARTTQNAKINTCKQSFLGPSYTRIAKFKTCKSSRLQNSKISYLLINVSLRYSSLALFDDSVFYKHACLTHTRTHNTLHTFCTSCRCLL